MGKVRINAFFQTLAAIAACLIAIAVGAGATYAVPPEQPKAVLIVSLKIQPYLKAVEGIQSRLDSAQIDIEQVFFLDEHEGKALEFLNEKIDKLGADILIAVGPEASHYSWEQYPGLYPKKLYSMVLNPEKVLPPDVDICGVSLNIPIKDQIRVLASAIPSIKRIGLIYDPQYNGEFAIQAILDAENMGLTIVPMMVHHRESIPAVLDEYWPVVQGLWLIPDRTIITERLVRYMIKDAIAHNVAVYGYNRFFHENGATVSYALDYKHIGLQTAEAAIQLLTEQRCQNTAPQFSILYNQKVLKALGFEGAIQEKDDGALGVKP